MAGSISSEAATAELAARTMTRAQLASAPVPGKSAFGSHGVAFPADFGIGSRAHALIAPVVAFSESLALEVHPCLRRSGGRLWHRRWSNTRSGPGGRLAKGDTDPPSVLTKIANDILFRNRGNNCTVVDDESVASLDIIANETLGPHHSWHFAVHTNFSAVSIETGLKAAQSAAGTAALGHSSSPSQNLEKVAARNGGVGGHKRPSAVDLTVHAETTTP